jgi:hypothetical protein
MIKINMSRIVVILFLIFSFLFLVAPMNHTASAASPSKFRVETFKRCLETNEGDRFAVAQCMNDFKVLVNKADETLLHNKQRIIDRDERCLAQYERCNTKRQYSRTVSVCNYSMFDCLSSYERTYIHKND